MKNNPQSVPRQATASTPLTPKISLIIPAQNEAGSIGKVLDDVPEGVSEKIVVDNGSTDDTAAVARKHGATVLHEPRKGYGYACLKGMNYLGETSKPPDIVVFMDGDYSDYPEELPKVVAPILEDRYDLVIGARSKALREPGSMTPQQVFGNWLATFRNGLGRSFCYLLN